MLKRSFNGAHSTLICHNSFKSLILYYSTSLASSDSKDGIANPLMVHYLVKSVGFSEQEAVSIVNKFKVSHLLKSTKKSELVVNFLKNNGFDEAHIRRVIVRVPVVLRSDVEKTLKPKITVFQELGFSGFDLGLIISRHPHVLQRSLKCHIVPTLEMLKSLIGNDEELISFLLKTNLQQLLSCNVLKFLPDNLLLLESYGVPSHRIKPLLLQRPVIVLARTHWLESILKGVEEKLRIPRTCGSFLYGVSVLGMTSEEKLKSWFQLFRSYGWSETEIFKLLRLHPSSLSRSENSLRLKLKYFMEDLGCGSDYLSTQPTLLSYSMKKRVVPRTVIVQTLKEKRLLKNDIRIYTYVKPVESEFVKRYVLPFKDTLPELYEYYTKTISVT